MPKTTAAAPRPTTHSRASPSARLSLAQVHRLGMEGDFDGGGDGGGEQAPPMVNPFAKGGGNAAGVMAMVANAASTLQRKGQEGEVRNAEAEPIPYLLMEEILERLKMHNYERLMPGSFKPLTRVYFAISCGNPTEQFHYFMAVCAWLMSLQRISWRAPSQMDNPNSAAASLYQQLQTMSSDRYVSIFFP